VVSVGTTISKLPEGSKLAKAEYVMLAYTRNIKYILEIETSISSYRAKLFGVSEKF
jgi:hypothetical protein